MIVVTMDEIDEQTRLLAEAREQAVIRWTARAEDMGASEVVGTRFMTSQIMGGG